MQSSSEQPLVGEEHCVTTRITAAKETRGHRVYVGIRYPMQTHGEASPCGHSTDTGDRWRHWLKIYI